MATGGSPCTAMHPLHRGRVTHLCSLSLSLSLSLVAHDPAEHPAPCTLHVQRAWRRVLGCARSRRAHARGCPASGVLVQAAQRCMCMSWNIRVMYECCQQCMHRHAARTRKTVCCTRKTVCKAVCCTRRTVCKTVCSTPSVLLVPQELYVERHSRLGACAAIAYTIAY